jgi:hypothetical protein
MCKDCKEKEYNKEKQRKRNEANSAEAQSAVLAQTTKLLLAVETALQLAVDVESKRIFYHVVVFDKVVQHSSKGLRYD